MATRRRRIDAERWERERFARLPSAMRRSRRSPASRSGRCTPTADLPAELDEAIGLPGEYPFTRGVYPSMYRGRLWTMRQFAGFGTARGDQRALPLPARPGADRPVDRVRHAVADGSRLRPPALARRGRARGRRDRHARRHGDAVRRHPARRGQRVDDDQRPRGDHARVLRRRGRAQGRSRPEELAGTIQTDILKEYIAQKEWCFPVDPAMRLVTDMIEWCAGHMPRWHPISITRLPHPRGRLDRRRRSSRSRSRTGSPTSSRRSRGAWTSTSSPRG